MRYIPMRRTAMILALSWVGWNCVAVGAEDSVQSFILAGLLLWAVAVAMIVRTHRAAVFMRQHSQAIWRAGLIRYFFRRW